MQWKTISKKYLMKTPFFKLRKDAVKLPSGLEIDDYYVFEKLNAAIVLGVTSDHQALLKKEYRYPIDKVLIELPGGTFDPEKEDALAAAKREYLEETGYQSDEWIDCGVFYNYPTKDTDKVHIFLAKNIRKVKEQNLEATEDIRPFFVPVSELKNMVLAGEIQVTGSITGIFKGLEHLST